MEIILVEKKIVCFFTFVFLPFKCYLNPQKANVKYGMCLQDSYLTITVFLFHIISDTLNISIKLVYILNHRPEIITNIWYEMIYNMMWYDMIWYDMIWYDMPSNQAFYALESFRQKTTDSVWTGDILPGDRYTGDTNTGDTSSQYTMSIINVRCIHIFKLSYWGRDIITK